MKSYAKVAVALVSVVAVIGCDSYLSGPGLTENPNSATEGTTLQQLIAVQANMFTRLEGHMARSAGMYTQQIVGSNNQQLTWGTQYGASESDIPGHMSAFYTGGGLVGMRNIQAGAIESGDTFIDGTAQVG